VFGRFVDAVQIGIIQNFLVLIFWLKWPLILNTFFFFFLSSVELKFCFLSFWRILSSFVFVVF
jgi:hypothetical protein